MVVRQAPVLTVHASNHAPDNLLNPYSGGCCPSRSSFWHGYHASLLLNLGNPQHKVTMGFHLKSDVLAAGIY
eukprot:1159483-Pelagomonas_calceolata.AAC.8